MKVLGTLVALVCDLPPDERVRVARELIREALVEVGPDAAVRRALELSAQSRTPE